MDRFAKRGKLRGRDDDRRWVRRDGVRQNADLTIDIGFGVRTYLDNVDAEIPPGLARGISAKTLSR